MPPPNATRPDSSSCPGVAGVGKSRLAWEFFKYIDGLAGDVLWHSGRCLSYGEGVSYWALSEMIRARFQISEEDPLDVVADRLRTGLERWIPDAADRDFIAPRLGQLLGLPTAQVLAKEELFSGWRLFFERLAEFLPVLLVIEDLQWADAGLVDFVDHLLEWSGDHAIFLLVLSRPEGTDRGGLVLSRRSVTTLPLDPLSDELMGRLLDGLVTDLPAPARSRIVERAEGIPLYAIETVRSLLDKGSLEKGDDGLLHLVGELGELAIPPGLTALIASRLDVLGSDERRLVKECSVLGTSFSRQAVEAVTDLDPAFLDDLLSSLVRKEVLTVRADKLSPERGQYAFTQSLIRSVAYDMLSRAERKARHLRTAAHMRAAFPDEGAEVAEVIGAHLFDAYKAAGDDPDAEELRAQACDAYTRAAERAASVGALEAAESAYLKAAELSSDEIEQARFTEAAGSMARGAGWQERAVAHFEAAIAVHARAGRIVDVARITSPLAEALDLLGHGEISIVRIREAIASLGTSDPPPKVLAALLPDSSGALLFSGHFEEANQAAEQALTLAQHHELTASLARGLNVKGILLASGGRTVEARMFFEEMAAVARENGLTREESTAENNLADVCMTRDLPGAEEHARAAVVLARRWGRREEEAFSAANLIYVLTMVGRLDEAYQLGLELLQGGGNERPGAGAISFALACLDAMRGNVAAAHEHAGALPLVAGERRRAAKSHVRHLRGLGSPRRGEQPPRARVRLQGDRRILERGPRRRERDVPHLVPDRRRRRDRTWRARRRRAHRCHVVLEASRRGPPVPRRLGTFAQRRCSPTPGVKKASSKTSSSPPRRSSVSSAIPTGRRGPSWTTPVGSPTGDAPTTPRASPARPPASSRRPGWRLWQLARRALVEAPSTRSSSIVELEAST